MTLVSEGVSQFKVNEEISTCQKCVLSKRRKRVLVNNSQKQKRFFILSEYPDIEDENGSNLFNPHSSSGVILNLINKLGISDNAHYAFALKCVPHEHTPDTGLSTCVRKNLAQELGVVSPSILFCFGMRAFFALSSIDSNLQIQYQNARESEYDNSLKTQVFYFNFNKTQIELYLFPTAQELKLYPKWRSPVWAQLAHFKQKKNIDS